MSEATHYCLVCNEERIIVGDLNDLSCEKCGAIAVPQTDERAIRAMFGIPDGVAFEGPFEATEVKS